MNDANDQKEEINILSENACESNINNSKNDTKKNISYFELILKYKNKININYNEFDPQKGENSPRLLFRKRKNDNSEGANSCVSKISNNSFDIIRIDRNNFNNQTNNPSSTQQNFNNLANIENTSNNPTNSNITYSYSLNNISNQSRNNFNTQPYNTNSLTANKTSTNKEKESNNEINLTEKDDRYSNNTKIFKILHEHADHKNANKIRTTFENYLDVVHDSYFSPEDGNGSWNNSNNNGNNNTNPCGNLNPITTPLCGDIPSPVEEDISNIMNNSSSKNSEKKSNVFQSTYNSNNISNGYFLNCFNSNNAANPNLFKFSSLDLLINPLRQKFIWETWSPYEIALFECCICKFGKNFDLYPKIIRTKKKDEILYFYYYWKQSKYYKIWKNSRYKRGKN